MTDAAPQPISTTAPALAGGSRSSQRWSDLAFLHWRVDSALIAPLLPEGIVPDEFDGSSWIGLIPFRLDRASIFGSPAIPYFGNFIEVNVRLYGVDRTGRRGVFFVSLEASRLAAVLAARVAFSLPYQWAATSVRREGDAFLYRSRRHGARHVGCDIRVTPSGEVVDGDELAEFLTARWGLFVRRGNRTLFLPNEHAPWQVFAARVSSLDDSLLERAGFPEMARRAPDSVLWSPGVTTRFGAAIVVASDQR